MARQPCWLFLCCGKRRKPEYRIEPDEESRLIPEGGQSQVPSHSRVVIIEQPEVQNKLGSIVRAKESKMVNMNSSLPFNLYNQPLGDGRSASRSSQSPYSLSRSHHQHPHRHVGAGRSGLSITPLESSSRASSSSRMADPPHPELANEGEEEQAEISRLAALNVRLLGAGVSEDVAARRRGRAKTKPGTDYTSEHDGEAATEGDKPGVQHAGSTGAVESPPSEPQNIPARPVSPPPLDFGGMKLAQSWDD